jgi:uncharacterized protein YkwD
MTAMFLLQFLLSLTNPCSSCEVVEELISEETSFSDSRYSISSDAFFNLHDINLAVNPESYDVGLLNAAVFFAANRVRAEHDLPELSFDSRLRNAALLHAVAMASRDFFSHTNPYEPQIKSLELRMDYVGFDWRRVGENIAMEFVLNYDGSPFYTEVNNGECSFYNTDYNLLVPRSYRELGEAIVQAWFLSPDHKEQMLQAHYDFMGCAVMLIPNRKGSAGMPMAFAVQTLAR